MPKILYVSNTANFSKFNLPFMKWCKEQGWQVDYCAPDDDDIEFCDKHIVLPIKRNPFHFSLCKCIYKLRQILEKNNYDIIHCHTPVASVIARLAARKLYKQGKVKIIYTAHGFHFYTGASLINWFFYYPVEKYLSKYCDVLITINDEDYQRALKKFKMKTLLKFNGIGVNPDVFYPNKDNSEKNQLRTNFGYSPEDFILIYCAEFIPRKNHQLLFEILPRLKQSIPELKVILAGKGVLLNYYKNEAKKLGIDDVIRFTGYSGSMSDLDRISNVMVFTSTQEGLSLSIVEALMTGLPVVASKIRGNTDIIEDGKNGFLCSLNNSETFLKSILKIYKQPELQKELSSYALISSKKFILDIPVFKMSEIYLDLIDYNS